MNARCESALWGSMRFCSSVSSFAQLQVVVLVAGAFREDRLEDVHVRLDARLAFLPEPRGQALSQVAGRRVKGAVERPREGLEDGAVTLPDLLTRTSMTSSRAAGLTSRLTSTGRVGMSKN